MTFVSCEINYNYMNIGYFLCFVLYCLTESKFFAYYLKEKGSEYI